MQIKITVTEEEINETIEALQDPCKYIKCGGIDCEMCPLKKIAEEVAEAQSTFVKKLLALDKK